MIEIKGRYNTAICYCDELEDSAYDQIKDMCDEEIFADNKIRIMPDVHSGKGCTVGTTMTVDYRIVPSLVGVDIGCGMELVKVKEKDIDFEKLDKLIRSEIPSGFHIRREPHELLSEIDLSELVCFKGINLERSLLSVGTLGGGNHFIEIDRDDDGYLYLVIHSGSRNLGVQIESYYRFAGIIAKDNALKVSSLNARQELIDRYKAEGRQREIQATLQKLKVAKNVPDKFVYVEDTNLDNYIHDMEITQKFADINRRAMTRIILEGMEWTEDDRFTTIHNYIDIDNLILRKGSVSAQKGERLLIPINMRDGALICIGKGNPDWNYSAPHGAGRILSRKQAKENLDVKDFAKTMEGIYTTCVAKSTIDESPMAYKSLDMILSQIEPTCEVISRIHPIYNFKAS